MTQEYEKHQERFPNGKAYNCQRKGFFKWSIIRNIRSEGKKTKKEKKYKEEGEEGQPVQSM